MRRLRVCLSLFCVLCALGLLAFVAHSPVGFIEYRTLRLKLIEESNRSDAVGKVTTRYKDWTTIPKVTHSPSKRRIDVLYTWVNGSEPEFLDAMNRALKSTGGTPVDTRDQRYYDAGTMRYSMRSLVMFAPWIGNVYVVTNGQVPCWLNTSNPRVKVIFHSEIFSNASHLPTFNSPAIEVHLHKIPGLSDEFLYFNDDVLLGANVTFDDFYTAKGGYKVYFGAKVPPVNEKEDKAEKIYYGSIRHTKQLFKDFFKFDVVHYTEHLPHLINRSIMQRLQTKLELDFSATSSHKFRQSDDIQIPAAYFNFLRSENISSEIVIWVEGSVLKRDTTVRYLWVDNDAVANEKRFGLPTDTKFYCINDKVDYSKRETAMKAVQGLIAYLKKRYPSRSEFENEKMIC